MLFKFFKDMVCLAVCQFSRVVAYVSYIFARATNDSGKVIHMSSEVWSESKCFWYNAADLAYTLFLTMHKLIAYARLTYEVHDKQTIHKVNKRSNP